MYPRRENEDEYGERATRHIFNCQFAITEFHDSLLDIQESHPLCILQKRRDETLRRSTRDAQIDIIAIDDRVPLDACVRRGDFP